MLVLTRYVGQAIVISVPNGTGFEDIKININSVNSATGQVKLGIEAPKDIPVHRQEVYEKLQATGETFTKKGHSIHED